MQGQQQQYVYMKFNAGQSATPPTDTTDLSRHVCVQPRALAVPELAFPAASEGLDIAVLRHDQGVVLSRGGCDETLAVHLDAHLWITFFFLRRRQ